jgi:hypothetical protein
MAIRAVLPLLVAALASGSIVGCRRRPSTLAQAAVVGAVTPRGPSLLTRFLETRPVTGGPPEVAPDLKIGPLPAAGDRREGGVPEVINVANDCSVHAVWWTAHLCGMTAKGSANWAGDSGLPLVQMSGTARTDCPAQVTRFETVITGLENGRYRFGTARKYVPFVVGCAKGVGPKTQ